MKKVITKFAIAIAPALLIVALMSEMATAQSWNTTGNTGTSGSTNFIGTIDNVAFKIRTKNVVRVTVTGSGNVGIGTASPTNKLTVSGNANFTGNVGIGTATPVAKLDVTGEVRCVNAGYGFTHTDGTTTLETYVDGNGGWFGTQSNHNLYFITNDAGGPQMTLATSGNFGIGTSNPNAQLQLANQIANRRIILWESANNDHQFAGFGMNANTLRYQVEGTGGNHVFYAATSTTASNELMRIQGDGRVSIGSSTAATGYQLTVNGKVICTDLRVQLAPFPDYVFAKNYQLPTISEVENHINVYNRLPGMPSATEVEEKGMTVGELQIKLVEKVEELTLYMIELSKKNQSLDKENQLLRDRLKNIETLIKK